MIFAAILWQILQHLGGYYVDHVVRHAQETSGLFAFVLGLLAWLYLGGQVTLIAAEINVVRARRLWPRSFFSHPLLEADKRALTSSAETEERVDEENVEVTFDGQQLTRDRPGSIRDFWLNCGTLADSGSGGRSGGPEATCARNDRALY